MNRFAFGRRPVKNSIRHLVRPHILNPQSIGFFFFFCERLNLEYESVENDSQQVLCMQRC